jgi:mannose-6-phosphate isomerase-like protein (cupin superfamily)
MAPEPIVIRPEDLDPGGDAIGETLAVGNWSAMGTASEVAPLHVHHKDDEAWFVIEGAIRFRLADSELVASEGTTVLVPAGVPHTFGNAGPGASRYLIITTARLREFISRLHAVPQSEHADLYRAYDSELLE